MQSLLGRALASLASLRGASAGVSLRAFSAAAAEGSVQEQAGVKNKLFKILGQAEHPLTAAELWERAAVEGLKSKRHMKQMLQQMKQAGHVRTQRLVGTKRAVKSFGYLLPQKAAPSNRAAA